MSADDGTMPIFVSEMVVSAPIGVATVMLDELSSVVCLSVAHPRHGVLSFHIRADLVDKLVEQFVVARDRVGMVGRRVQ